MATSPWQRLGKIIAEATSNNAGGARSGKRTAAIHEVLGDIAVNINPSLKFKTEYTVTTPTGPFKVDISLEDATTGELRCLISFKAVMGNLGQNFRNFETTQYGETMKVRSSSNVPKHVPFVLFDVLPESCPYYTKDGDVKHTETLRINEKKAHYAQRAAVLNRLGMNATPVVLYVNYDYASRGKMTFNSVADDTDMETFYNIIRSV
jgi:hypothetical protein